MYACKVIAEVFLHASGFLDLLEPKEISPFIGIPMGYLV